MDDYSRALLKVTLFLAVWAACSALGYYLPPLLMERQDVEAALLSYILGAFGAPVGPAFGLVAVKVILKR